MNLILCNMKFRKLGLESYGVDSVTALRVMGSYLSNRVQAISISGARLQPKHVVQGVQQGSVLGPTLLLGDDIQPSLLQISF